jgi:hypothetical protein
MKKNVKTFKQFERMNERHFFDENYPSGKKSDDDMFIAKGDSGGGMKKIIVASIKDGNINMVSFEKSENFDQLDSIYNEQIGYEHDEIYVIEVDDTCWGDDCFIAAKDLQSGNISSGMKILKVYDAISAAENM